MKNKYEFDYEDVCKRLTREYGPLDNDDLMLTTVWEMIDSISSKYGVLPSDVIEVLTEE